MSLRFHDGPAMNGNKSAKKCFIQSLKISLSPKYINNNNKCNYQCTNLAPVDSPFLLSSSLQILKPEPPGRCPQRLACTRTSTTCTSSCPRPTSSGRTSTTPRRETPSPWSASSRTWVQTCPRAIRISKFLSKFCCRCLDHLILHLKIHKKEKSLFYYIKSWFGGNFGILAI